MISFWQVDKYIDKQKAPQKEICQKLRRLIFDQYPKIEEEMRWGVPAYGDGRYYIDGGGKTMKHLKISSPKEIDRKRIVKLLKLVEERQK